MIVHECSCGSQTVKRLCFNMLISHLAGNWSNFLIISYTCIIIFEEDICVTKIRVSSTLCCSLFGISKRPYDSYDMTHILFDQGASLNVTLEWSKTDTSGKTDIARRAFMFSAFRLEPAASERACVISIGYYSDLLNHVSKMGSSGTANGFSIWIIITLISPCQDPIPF